MYKVFINEVPVFFTEISAPVTGFVTVLYKELDCQFLFQKISKNPKVKINVICEDLKKDWLNFVLNFELREAAGGVVKNKKNALLWIYRLGKWDLPKGHIEANESKQTAAIREVEEECGVTGLVIHKELETTYHVFEQNGKRILKKTYWFLMGVNGEQNLMPQKEEGITRVEFKSPKESLTCLSNTYQNIKSLLMHVL